MFFENGIDNTRCDVNELHDRELSTAKDNGLFCGHDWFGEGVQRAVKEFAQNNNLKIEPTTSSWILRK